LSQANSLNAVIRSLAGSTAVTVLSQLVTTQTSVHFAHLAEQVTATSPTAQVIQQLQAAMTPLASSTQQAYATAIQQIGNQLTRQATMLAQDDVFFYMTVMAVVAIIFVALIPIPKVAPGGGRSTISE